MGGMKWILGCYMAAVLAVLALPPLVNLGGKHEKAIKCVGSTSIQPMAEMLAEEYARLHPGVNVEVQGGGSTTGIQSVREGIAEVGMCSRSLKAEEQTDLVGQPIAYDGLAIVVHPSNPIEGLTRAQIRDIYSSNVTDWRQVGGHEGPIRIITREEGSGTREAFTKLVMECDHKLKPAPRISRKALTQESNGAVKELVRHDRFAVGYMSLGLVHGELKLLAVDGIMPSEQSVHEKDPSRKYSLVRPFLFVRTRQQVDVQTPPAGSAEANARLFIDFVLSAQGQRLLEREGLVGVGAQSQPAQTGARP
jgi:phosphate transport system substrate-binding protein